MWPTLEEVLTRKTEPPLCLYNFYLVMRDRLDAADVLDCYLDVRHHQLLWRKHLKTVSEKDATDLIPSSPSTTTLSTFNTTRSSIAPSSRPKKHKHKQPRAPPSHDDLTASTHRIAEKYLVEGAKKQLHLPHDLNCLVLERIHEGRIDPDLFAELQALLLTMMHNHAYPVFLRVKACANVTDRQKRLRLVVALLTLLIALSTALCFIFLGYPVWQTRFSLLLPFWCAVYNGIVFVTGIDPIWALFFNVSETTTFHFNTIQEPHVKRYLRSRSICYLLASLIVALLFTVIFSAIPPRRL